MVAQKALSFQYELAKRDGEVTGLGGLPVFFELAVVAGLREAVGAQVRLREGQQGWSDWELLSALWLLNLAGGDCVDDVERLEADAGLGQVMNRLRTWGMKRKARRALERRWRKERTRAFPSPSAVRRWLARFHDAAEEVRREMLRQAEDQQLAFIPKKTEALEGLVRVNAALVEFVQRQRPRTTATLDMDATLVETWKKQALFSYKKFRAFQPLNTWWAEQRMVLHSEFRDGNVPAGFEQRRVLEEALACLPGGVERVYLRSDTAGYQWDLLRYCEQGRHPRFGRIEFVVGVDITDAFREAIRTTPDIVWHDMGRGDQQWAEVSFVPNALGATKRGSYRFIATRELVRQQELFDDQPAQLPFPTLIEPRAKGRDIYKLHAVVTNRMVTPAPEIIQWYRDRCGKSEEAHSIMKRDLAGGQLPSKLFGANAAWWQTMIVALNLVAAMKHVALDPRPFDTMRMKALRLRLIALPARVIHHANQLTLRLGASLGSFAEVLLEARARILALAQGPAG